MASTHRRMSAEFLPVWLALGDLDQLDGRLVERRRVAGEAAPVGVGLLGDDLALLDQPLEDPVDLEPVAAVLEAEADVLEVDEHGERPLAVGVPGGFIPVSWVCGRRPQSLQAVQDLLGLLGGRRPRVLGDHVLQLVDVSRPVVVAVGEQPGPRRAVAAAFSSSARRPRGRLRGRAGSDFFSGGVGHCSAGRSSAFAVASAFGGLRPPRSDLGLRRPPIRLLAQVLDRDLLLLQEGPDLGDVHAHC